MTAEVCEKKHRARTVGLLSTVFIMLFLCFGLMFNQNYAHAYTISGKASYSYQTSEESTTDTSFAIEGEQQGLAGNNAEGEMSGEEGATETLTLEDSEVPLSVLDAMSGRWALMNLLLTLFTAFVTIVLLINYIIRRNDRLVFIAVSAVATSAATILFLLSENTGFPMQMFDEYTAIHLAILAVSLFCAFIELRRVLPAKEEHYN